MWTLALMMTTTTSQRGTILRTDKLYNMSQERRDETILMILTEVTSWKKILKKLKVPRKLTLLQRMEKMSLLKQTVRPVNIICQWKHLQSKVPFLSLPVETSHRS